MDHCPSPSDELAIVSVNYRSADDTIEMIESVLAGSVIPRLIVVDNDSGDDSVERIRAWAGAYAASAEWRAIEGHLGSEAPPFFEFRAPNSEMKSPKALITLVASGKNGGFSFGNNVGLRIAMQNPGTSFFWLLNNDTTVDHEASAAIIKKCREVADLGMAGTQVRLYHRPSEFQLLNGMRFDKWTGAAAGIWAGEPVTKSFDPQAVESETDFICGASLVLSRDYIRRYGLLEEKFFLYYEEIDLAMRSKGVLSNVFVSDAIVYHKEGASAGSASQLSNRARSPLSEYHHIRSKMIFARKHFPMMRPLYFLQNLAIVMRRLLRGHRPQAIAVARATFGLPL